MLLQVGELPCDQPSMRFLWREDPTSNVAVHQYTRHIFGAKDSSTCANYALQPTVSDNAKEYPEAAKAVIENDYLDSPPLPPEKALIRSKEVVHLLHLGGFKLTKFVSNVQDLADRIDGSAQSTEPKIIVSSKEESMHVPGLKWDHNNDTLVVSRGTNSTITKSLTQRLILILLSKVYRTVYRKVFSRLANITIRRSYFSGPFQHLEIHMFSDSSQDVFSAVEILGAQVTCTSGEIMTELQSVLCTAHVAPMKIMRVPELELQAALLAARLKKEICRALTVTVDKVFMWTVSTIVLQWINSANKHPIFIANLVSEILENTSVGQWNHVATCNNPAEADAACYVR